MADSNNIEALREAISPVEELRGDGSKIADSVSDSFAELEALHEELDQWQQELTRQQAELDARQSGDQSDLDKLREELAQLEKENAEKLHALEGLERDHASTLAELDELRRKNSEVNQQLDDQRAQANAQHNQWMTELAAMRATLGRHTDLLEHGPGQAMLSQGEPASLENNISRAAELRRRANSRRNGKRDS